MTQKASLSLIIVVVGGLLALAGPAWGSNPNLVAHWKFDEGTGTIAYDSVGDNDGTLNGDPNWTTGQVDGALAFDGQHDHISLPNNAVTTTEFTLSAWANPYGPGGGVAAQNVIFCQRDHLSGGGYNRSLVFLATELYDYSPHAAAIIRSSSGPRQDLKVPMKDYNEWHHYTMTVDPNDFVFYIDGVEVSRTANLQTGDYITSIDEVYIGKHWYYGRTEGLFNGAIDEVRVYDRALSAEEVELLYYWAGPTPSEQAVMAIADAIDEKLQALESINAALEKEWEAYDTLEELLASGDYGELDKGDIVKAKQKIHSATQHQEQSADALEKSIKKLQHSLVALGVEPEPNDSIQQQTLKACFEPLASSDLTRAVVPIDRPSPFKHSN